MFLDALDRILEAFEEVTNPRELALLALAVVMVVYGAFAGVADTVSIALIVIGSGMFFIGIFLPVLTEFQIGPSGFSAKLRERDEDVRATLEPHTEGLLQTAALLTGDRGSGMALLERALYQTYLQWHQAKDDGPVETVRQHLSTLAPTIGERAIGNTVETP